eukprot:252240-Amphidinium_carterae.1
MMIPRGPVTGVSFRVPEARASADESCGITKSSYTTKLILDTGGAKAMDGIEIRIQTIPDSANFSFANSQ